MLTRRCSLGRLLIVLVIAGGLAGCGNKQAGELPAGPPLPVSLLPSVQSTVQSTVLPTVRPKFQPTVKPAVRPTIRPTIRPTSQPTILPTPTSFSLGPLFHPNLDLRAGPIEVPLKLQIPSLKVDAPVLGVGLTSRNVMDAPKGPVGDPVWHTAFWYRGSGNPGEPGTATIAGHVNDPLGQHKIFAHLGNLHPGDLVIVHYTAANIDIRFIVDQVKVYSTQESANPSVLTQIYGAGPVTGTGPQPAPDGLSHLTLITCAGNFVKGQFDHHTVVYATRSQ